MIPHADVLFVNKHYAQHYTSSPTCPSPRAFLLSLTSTAAPHALLVAHWGAEGAAVLSLPTKEYFQSSGWVENEPPSTAAQPAVPDPSPRHQHAHHHQLSEEVQSLRSGSEFWADGRSRTPSSAAWGSLGTQSQYLSSSFYSEEDDNDDDSQGTEVPAEEKEEVIDEVGAQDAFVAGMIFALSRRVLPGAPYTPGSSGSDDGGRTVEGKWRLDECLRFATELAGRKARRRNWDGLAAEMARSGWFDN